MPHTPSLEELRRHAVTFPGARVAIAALQTALGHLEEELERSADQIALRLRARHAQLRDELHPEDQKYEEYDLDRTVNVLLPRVVRGGFVLTLWSTFEVAALDLAQYAYRESGKALDADPFRAGSFLNNLDSVFTKGLGVPAFPDSTIRQRLDELRLFRHALIHHGGKIDKLPPTLKRATPAEYAAIGLHFYEDLRHQCVVPNQDSTGAFMVCPHCESRVNFIGSSQLQVSPIQPCQKVYSTPHTDARAASVLDQLPPARTGERGRLV